MTGGVSKLKYHLAKLLGHDASIYPIVTSKIMRSTHDSINAKDRKKEETATNKTKLAAFGLARSSGVSTTATEGIGRGSTESTTERASFFFAPRTGVGAQPSIKSAIKKREKEETYWVMGRCLFWSDLHLTITKNNPFWQPMCDVVAVDGPWYKSATFEELWGTILQAEKDINVRWGGFKKSR